AQGAGSRQGGDDAGFRPVRRGAGSIADGECMVSTAMCGPSVIHHSPAPARLQDVSAPCGQAPRMPAVARCAVMPVAMQRVRREQQEGIAMRRSSFFLSLSVALAAGGFQASAAVLPEASGARSVWLVQFEEAPLATFRGAEAKTHPRLQGLDATSPAVTGKARLDVESAASRAYRAALSTVREERLAQAGARIGRRLEPMFVYDVVNHGVALELTPTEADALARVAGVASVEPEFVHVPLTDAGPSWIRADALWQ